MFLLLKHVANYSYERHNKEQSKSSSEISGSTMTTVSSSHHILDKEQKLHKFHIIITVITIVIIIITAVKPVIIRHVIIIQFPVINISSLLIRQTTEKTKLDESES